MFIPEQGINRELGILKKNFVGGQASFLTIRERVRV